MNNKLTGLTAGKAIKKKIDDILSLEKITSTDVQGLNKQEVLHLEQKATKILTQLTGEDRDRFLDKLNPILPADTKNSVWEYNHLAISNAISNFMCQHGVMPAKNAIAEQTGLSRQTVAKHFREYTAHPQFTAETEQFKFMAHKMLAGVFKFASNGDMKAARLYFEMIGVLNKPPAGTVINKQNNYIQINNTILSQDKLKQLTAEQLNQIESIVNCYQQQTLS